MPTDTPAAPPPPEPVYKHLSPAEFRADPENVNGLVDFLRSRAGINVLRVLQGLNPMATLSRPEAFDASHVRGILALQEGRGDAHLALCQGYNLIYGLLTQELPTHTTARTRTSRKATGAKSAITPHRTELP